MVRLILLIILLLMSLLCVLRAPQFHLWYIAIVVTEFPWVCWLITTIALLWGFRVDRYQLAGTIAGIAALILFVVPVIQAMSISSKLDGELDTAFGCNQAASGQPFRPLAMITGIGKPRLRYETMTYSNVNGLSLTMNYYRAQVPGNRPCVVVVHGGSWAGGDSHQLPELNTCLAKAGYNVTSINYRLAPQYHSPAPVEDIYAAIGFLKANAGKLNIDTGSFILLGRSAGAQLVLDAAYLHPVAGVKGVINFYGPADMIWGYQNPASPLVFNSCKLIEDFLGGTYDQLPQAYQECSPIRYVNDRTVPTLSIHGKNDPLVAYGHSTRLEEKLQHAGVRHYLLTLPWGTHGMDFTLNGPGGQLSTHAVLRFLHCIVP